MLTRNHFYPKLKKPDPTHKVYPNMSNLIGRKYGALKVLDVHIARTSGGNPKRMLRVRCDCGAVFVRADKSIQKAKYPTCRACYVAGVQKEFGNQHPLYRTWENMTHRCYDPKFPYYERYGGRGITVCARWCGVMDRGQKWGSIDGFKNFVADMGDKPAKSYSVDRIDNDGPYSPENCRWATAAEQAANREDTTLVEISGHVKPVGAWAVLLGIPSSSLYTKIKNGHDPREALLDAVAAQMQTEHPA